MRGWNSSFLNSPISTPNPDTMKRIMTKLQKLIEEAKQEAAKTNHIILVGLPAFADARQSSGLFDTGGRRKSWRKWEENMRRIDAAVWPNGDVSV
jgi:hypothetical protein